jgi:glycosyltransferase involved in cell wall biosynthesis
LAFFLLPIRSIIIFAQIVYHTARLKKKFGPFHIFFTVNAFTAWTGLVLKRFRLVNKTIFWVWDYYPPIHKSKMITFMRWMYWLFDRPASIQADKTVFLSNTMYRMRKNMGILPQNGSMVVGIGTNPIQALKTKKNPLSLIFIGVIKKSQGLDIVFDSANKLNKIFPNISLTIIGGGPDEEYFRKRAKKTKLDIHFLGYLKSTKKMRDLISDCHIGIAPYIPERGNVSYYGDPSKIKEYLSCGLPVITTNVFDFSSEIAVANAGILIDYNEASFINGIKTINNNYRFYQHNANKLGKKYIYSTLYKKIFI